MKEIRFLFTLTFLWIASSQVVCAQENTIEPITEEDSLINSYFSLPMDDLLSLKVETGSFMNLDLQHSSMSLTVITGEQVQLSGARHLSEVLEIYVPGFQYMINKWNGIIWGMRGVAPDRNTNFVFLVNGHKMNHESRDGAMSELDLGLLGDIERIEVLRGPGGIVYGSGAMAGVINIVTKRFVEDQIEASARVETWRMSSFGSEYQIGIGRKLDDKTSIIANLGYRVSQGVGQERSRLYGRPGWPYPQWLEDPPPNGVPSTGSAQSTPGNLKLSLDLERDRWRMYSRMTHQVTNGSGWFVIDPWPEIVGNPDSSASDRMVDGVPQSYDSFLANTEAYGSNRRQYQIDNVTSQLSYRIPINGNELKFSGGFDMVTNRILFEQLDAYSALRGTERAEEVWETFGERRYNIGALYSRLNEERFQFAVGTDFRMYDIGADMRGDNSQAEKASHPIVSDVTYFYGSAFGEGVYKVSDKLDLHGGLRYDLHTRTAIHGGVLNPKIGALYTPHKNHTLKLVYQQSANNGSADSYEFNRNSFDDNGNPVTSDDYHYENPFNPPTTSSPVIPPVNEEILHSLKPEKSQSIEFMGFHKLTDEFIVLHSTSLNRISDLFAWNQTLFRIVNSGSYDFMNIDLEFQYNTKRINLGINHSFQRVINMDVVSKNQYVETPVFDSWDSVLVGNQYYYTPVVAQNSLGGDSVITQIVNPITDGITVDGANFLNLNTHLTKVYFDLKATDWLTLHTNFRVFWGLKGRKDVHEYTSETNANQALDRLDATFANNTSYPYLDIHNSPMIKCDIGISLTSKDDFSVSFHMNNVFGRPGSRNSIRWQKSGIIGEHTDLYGVDLRSYSIKVAYLF